MLMTTSSRCHLSPRRGAAADLVGDRLAEFEAPLPHRLVADGDAAGGQHLLNHAQAERKAEIQPDRVADDLSREAIAGIDRVPGVVMPACIACRLALPSR